MNLLSADDTEGGTGVGFMKPVPAKVFQLGKHATFIGKAAARLVASAVFGFNKVCR